MVEMKIVKRVALANKATIEEGNEAVPEPGVARDRKPATWTVREGTSSSKTQTTGTDGSDRPVADVTMKEVNDEMNPLLEDQEPSEDGVQDTGITNLEVEVHESASETIKTNEVKDDSTQPIQLGPVGPGYYLKSELVSCKEMKTGQDSVLPLVAEGMKEANEAVPDVVLIEAEDGMTKANEAKVDETPKDKVIFGAKEEPDELPDDPNRTCLSREDIEMGVEEPEVVITEAPEGGRPVCNCTIG